MLKRNLNLNLIPLEDALFKYFSKLEGLLKPGCEEISIKECLDRITLTPVYAKINSPHYNASAMDGIAVRSIVTNCACESNPIELKIDTDFINVNTGDPVRHPYDAVIMAEDLIEHNENFVKIIKSAMTMQHVRPIGENIKAKEVILPEKHKIRPIDINVLLSGGIRHVNVFSKPKVAILPTGNEIIEISALQEGEEPKEGVIIDSNSRMYEALVKQAGAIGKCFAPIPDDYNILKDIILKAANEFDMVLINAGSSAGTEDFTVQVLREIGEVIVHGVAVKPGKPVILAIVNGKPVIGTPGYPVSAYLSFVTFAAPVLSVLTGNKEKTVQKIEAVLSEKITSSVNLREYIRVKLEHVNGKLTAFPLVRNSSVAMSLVKADGFCIIERGCEKKEKGETVIIELIN